MPKTDKLVVLYDGGCRMCVGVTGWLSRIAYKDQFLLVPYQDSDFLSQHPEIDPAQCEKEIHVIDPQGHISRGADAMLNILKASGHWSRFLVPVLQVPPFIWLGRLVYKLIARYRRDIAFPS